jgi:dienelactone hydrolase
MMRAEWLGLLVLLLTACARPMSPVSVTPTVVPAQSEILEFTSATFAGELWTPWLPPAADGTPTTVRGTLTLPPRGGAIPAVILTHGCAGVTSAETAWVSRLQSLGIATLLIHSFGSRGITEICSGQQTVHIASMLADVYQARARLAEDPRIDSARIALLGLSFGGRTVLWASQARFQQRYGHATGFAAYLAFYPASCYLRLAEEEQVQGGPIRIFHGLADDWTPIGPCQDYVARLQRAGVDAAVLAYAGARHGFDDPSAPPQALPHVLTPRACTFVEQEGGIMDAATGAPAKIDAPCVERGVTIGYDATAAQAAVADVQAVLMKLFALE